MRSDLRETEGATAEQKPPIVTHLDIDSAESRRANPSSAHAGSSRIERVWLTHRSVSPHWPLWPLRHSNNLLNSVTGSVITRPILHVHDRLIASSSVSASNKGGSCGHSGNAPGSAREPPVIFSATLGGAAGTAISFKVAPQTLSAPSSLGGNCMQFPWHEEDDPLLPGKGWRFGAGGHRKVLLGAYEGAYASR